MKFLPCDEVPIIGVPSQWNLSTKRILPRPLSFFNRLEDYQKVRDQHPGSCPFEDGSMLGSGGAGEGTSRKGVRRRRDGRVPVPRRQRPAVCGAAVPLAGTPDPRWEQVRARLRPSSRHPLRRRHPPHAGMAQGAGGDAQGVLPDIGHGPHDPFLCRRRCSRRHTASPATGRRRASSAWRWFW